MDRKRCDGAAEGVQRLQQSLPAPGITGLLFHSSPPFFRVPAPGPTKKDRPLFWVGPFAAAGPRPGTPMRYLIACIEVKEAAACLSTGLCHKTEKRRTGMRVRRKRLCAHEAVDTYAFDVYIIQHGRQGGDKQVGEGRLGANPSAGKPPQILPPRQARGACHRPAST